MKFITKFGSFLINELFKPTEEVKEHLEDYLLEIIDESMIESSIRIDGYVNPEFLDNQNFSTYSGIQKGSLPVYDYKLKLKSCYRMLDIKKVINRISKDSNFKIVNYRCSNSESLLGDGSIQESTNINIRFVYMLNPKADTPKEVSEMSPKLEELGFVKSVDRFGVSYYWNKIISKEVEMPLEWFSKVRNNGQYKPITSKHDLISKRLNEIFEDDVKSEFEEIKKIIPNLPDLSIEAGYYSFRSRIDKFGLSFWCYPVRYERESDVMKLELQIQISYYNKDFQ